MPWSKSVYSSHVSEVGWDERDGLLVTWKSGKVSAYAGVLEETAIQLANAPSVGGMLAGEIKPFFEHRYVR
jgi:hypothetical protein